jgi:hypothetical protein
MNSHESRLADHPSHAPSAIGSLEMSKTSTIPKLCKLIVEVLLFAFLGSGCATFQLTNVETVNEGEKHTGVTTISTRKYYPIRLVKPPDKGNANLIIELEKQIVITHGYKRNSYRQNVYERPRNSFEECVSNSNESLTQDPISGIIMLPFHAAYAVINTLTGGYVRPEVRKERIPGSDKVRHYTKRVSEDTEASGELIRIQENPYYTNEKGIVTYRCSDDDLLGGIIVELPRQGKAYILKREEMQREVTAEWRSKALVINKGISLSSAAYDIYRGYKTVKHAATLASAAGGIAGVAARLAIGYAIESAAEFVIRDLSTREETYYKWTVVELRRAGSTSD